MEFVYSLNNIQYIYPLVYFYQMGQYGMNLVGKSGQVEVRCL